MAMFAMRLISPRLNFFVACFYLVVNSQRKSELIDFLFSFFKKVSNNSVEDGFKHW